MRIVTTPMCEEIVKLAGIEKYNVNKFPTAEDGDFAILLSESKTDLESLYLKLNTFKQIRESIEKVAERCGGNANIDFGSCEMAAKYLDDEPVENSTRVRVYSNFLKDIVLDMGFAVSDEDYDYAIAPDYLIEKIDEDVEIIEIPSHGAVSLNPVKRACERYEILEDFINK